MTTMLPFVNPPLDQLGCQETRRHGAHAGSTQSELSRQLHLRGLPHSAERIKDAGLPWMDAERRQPVTQALFEQMREVKMEVKVVSLWKHDGRSTIISMLFVSIQTYTSRCNASVMVTNLCRCRLRVRREMAIRLSIQPCRDENTSDGRLRGCPAGKVQTDSLEREPGNVTVPWRLTQCLPAYLASQPAPFHWPVGSSNDRQPTHRQMVTGTMTASGRAQIVLFQVPGSVSVSQAIVSVCFQQGTARLPGTRRRTSESPFAVYQKGPEMPS